MAYYIESTVDFAKNASVIIYWTLYKRKLLYNYHIIDNWQPALAN